MVIIEHVFNSIKIYKCESLNSILEIKKKNNYKKT